MPFRQNYLSRVELVVLSACETALGEPRSGEGMIGLRRAFGLAGAKTVVSSLCSVKDRSTSQLMQCFHENLLLHRQSRADALRNAQLELLSQNRASERAALPSTWGAFVRRCGARSRARTSSRRTDPSRRRPRVPALADRISVRVLA